MRKERLAGCLDLAATLFQAVGERASSNTHPVTELRSMAGALSHHGGAEQTVDLIEDFLLAALRDLGYQGPRPGRPKE